MSKQEVPSGVKSFFKSVSMDFEDFKPLVEISKKANVEPGQIVLGGFVVLLVLIFIGTADFFLTALVGIAYPSYMSFKALHFQDNDSILQWLVYWVIFGLISVGDRCLGFLLAFIPFYSLFKLLVIVWLFYPKTRGAQKLYLDYLKPALDTHREAIEKVLNNFLYAADYLEKMKKGN